MGWIRNRILSEYHKHKKLDWAKLAENKIVAELGRRVQEKFVNNKQFGEILITDLLIKELEEINKGRYFSEEEFIKKHGLDEGAGG